MSDTEFNDMQRAKRCMFSMRNGVVADALRKGGSPFQIIFGVNLPQLVEIAAELPHTAQLATELWHNTTTRESMLIAPMLMPREQMTIELARVWIEDIPCAEVADIFCHRLLRHLSYAPQLAQELLGSETDMKRYTGLRLWFNLVNKYPREALDAATKEASRSCRLTQGVAAMLADEARFVLGED